MKCYGIIRDNVLWYLGVELLPLGESSQPRYVDPDNFVDNGVLYQYSCYEYFYVLPNGQIYYAWPK